MDVTRRRFWASFQLGCAYIGTVVGAGFASGREIYQFFARYGNAGYLAILISTFLFAYVGFRLLDLGRRLSAKSFREVNHYLFGRYAGYVVDTLCMLMLFGVTVAMLAGSGELFRERLNASFQLGVLLTILVTFLTVLKGISGLLKANTVIVPMMVLFVLYTGLHALWTHGVTPALANGRAMHGSPVMSVVSAIIYAAFNIGLSAGVLIPLGAQINDPLVLRQGARLGAVGLGAMLILVMYALLTYAPTALQYEVPMAYIATRLGTFIQWGFVFVLWGEIYSTLVGNVYALSAQSAHRSQRMLALHTAVLLGIAFLCSQIGFARLVAVGYTLFGWVSLFLLLAIAWPRKNLPDA